VLNGFRVLVVLASKPAAAGYFNRRFFRVVQEILGAYQAVDYNVRLAGKRKWATLFFLGQMKRYFDLKYFQILYRGEWQERAGREVD
jgi:hypothetical protein